MRITRRQFEKRIGQAILSSGLFTWSRLQSPAVREDRPIRSARKRSRPSHDPRRRGPDRAGGRAGGRKLALRPRLPVPGRTEARRALCQHSRQARARFRGRHRRGSVRRPGSRVRRRTGKRLAQRNREPTPRATPRKTVDPGQVPDPRRLRPVRRQTAGRLGPSSCGHRLRRRSGRGLDRGPGRALQGPRDLRVHGNLPVRLRRPVLPGHSI